MNIQSDYNSYNYNVSMYGRGGNVPRNGSFRKFIRKIQQKLLDKLPEKTFNDTERKLNKYSKYDSLITRPDVNRLIMGATALTTQPAIDYFNHRVDEETRTVSRNRTIAKIIACTSVGILVRGSCYQLVNKMTNVNAVSKIGKCLLPKDFINSLKNDAERLSKYKSAVSTILALCVMLITNFVLDAPLTVYFTNKLNARSERKKQKKEVANG